MTDSAQTHSMDTPESIFSRVGRAPRSLYDALVRQPSLSNPPPARRNSDSQASPIAQPRPQARHDSSIEPSSQGLWYEPTPSKLAGPPSRLRYTAHIGVTGTNGFKVVWGQCDEGVDLEQSELTNGGIYPGSRKQERLYLTAADVYLTLPRIQGYFPLRRRPVLSNELIDYIIGFVGDTNYDAQENIYICDCASLLACCLISKSFLPTARRLLYQSLTLESAGPSSIYPLNLIKTLEDSPALGQNVENLLLRCGAGPNEALTDATSRLLSKCRHLKHLYIETCKDEITDKYVELPSLITAISFSCPPLRSLHLAGISFARADSFVPLASYLWEKCTITHIGIRGVDWPEPNAECWKELAPRTTRLTSFEHDLLDGSGDTSTALHFATASSKYSLASMTLRSGPGVDLLALGYFSNLTHLDWRVQLPEDDPLFLQTHLQVLRDLSNLEHLQLSTENAPGAFTPLASTVTHLDFLPLSLKHIEVPFLSPSVLLLFVFKQASPNLKVLALVQPANADQNLWTRETIEGLDWACRSRGVRFYREHVVVMG